jgi:hypothetical protein
MPKNYNIITKTVNPKNTTGSAVVVGSSVAAGMTRYVTFIAVSPRTGATGKGRRLYLCSTAASSTASTDTLASAAAKMKYVQCSASAESNVHIPSKINTEAPLFTIAASKWLTVHQSSAQAGSGACSVFVQYYDQ